MKTAREMMADIKEQAQELPDETSSGGLLEKLSDGQFDELADRVAAHREKQAAVSRLSQLNQPVTSHEDGIKIASDIKKAAFRRACRKLGITKQGQIRPIDLLGTNGQDPVVKLATVGAQTCAFLLGEAFATALNPGRYNEEEA